MRQLPSDIIPKIDQSLQTIGNNADPKMQVVVARAKSSIQDASYFTVENIQTKPGLSDISVAARRQKLLGAPDGLFVINLDSGIAKTLFRAYPDVFKAGWTPQFSLGPAKSVAVCFDGHWERYRNLWNLITEETPYLFWVDMSNKLYTQLWSDDGSRDELATNVLKIKAARGWKNAAFMDKDNGLVAGYIKTDNKVYYRNYCLQPNGQTVWESERELEEFTGTAVNINMFVTNDYRTAFIIEDNLGKIHWFISERNWAGMASPTDNLRVNVSEINFTVIPAETYQVIPESMVPIIPPPPEGLRDRSAFIKRIPDYQITTAVTPLYVNVCPATISLVPDLIAHERLEYEDRKTVELIFNCELVCNIPALMNSFQVITGQGKLIELESIQQTTNSLILKFIQPVDIMDTILISLGDSKFYNIGARINETCVIDYGKAISLSVPGRPPQVNENLPVFIDVNFTVYEFTEETTKTDENLTVTISELDFTVTEVSTTPQSYEEEQLTTSISNMIFTVTQIGTSPV